MFEYKITNDYEECVIDMSKICEKEKEMNRLTHERSNGIKSGYWSPDKKQDLVNRLAEYENTDLTPQQIKDMQFCLREKSRECAELRRELHELKNKKNDGWIPVEERLPEDNKYILLSFSNFGLQIIGRYDKDEEGNGSFYIGDCDEQDTCIANDLYVNAWHPLPEPYRPERTEEE